ncbi:response regulator [Flavobacterium magnum]|uniref:Response regulator n=1 Tax=Flavobacterium magnum TaxID=2162713 RepID=A0A2S0RGB3_9FLAO|nr:response regulator [Flavobacterium magnum]AWA29752.1 response regulator [Flavobacterium magnum]
MSSALTIFYTDDDQDDLELFRDVVKTLGRPIDVVMQSKPEELLRDLENPPPSPQIIFLDLNMPGKNGFEVLKELKNHNHYKNIPIVIFSTSNDDKNVARSHELGANFYLPKLSSYDDFRKSIDFTLQINWNTFNPTLSGFKYQN